MRVLYEAEISFKIGTYEDKYKLKQLMTTKTVLQKTLKPILHTEEKEW